MKIILGLDPGTAITGYGVVSHQNGETVYVAHGCITTSKDLPMPARLVQIGQELRDILARYSPTEVAIEELFFFRNLTTVMTVSQARGVLVETVASHGLPVRGFTPLQVKNSVTGYGKADKIQIQKMVKMILGLSEVPKPDDAADALAIAITAAHHQTVYT